jgi:site-specific recombinase XerD
MQEVDDKKLSDLSKRFLQAISYCGLSGYKLKKDNIISSESTLTSIKKGIQLPSKKTIDAFCEKYDVSRAWLYTGEGLFAKTPSGQIEPSEKDIRDALKNARMQSDSTISKVAPYLQDILVKVKYVPIDAAASLREFDRIIYFSDLTKANITLYDDWLHAKGYSQPTIYNYHKRNKRYIHEAIKFDLLKNDPYKGERFSRGKHAIRKYLTAEELKKVKDAQIDSETICRVRDLFIFQAYTGISYADLAKFNFKRDVQKRGNKYVILDIRLKTEENYFIVLLSPAMEILRKYDYVLPIISNQQYNLRLKIVADYAELDRNLTVHMSRHTFATMCLNNGVKMENVSKMLGHTNVRTTQQYAKVLNAEVEKDFEMLERILS